MQLSSSSIPIGLQLFQRGVGLFLVAAQIHLFIGLRRLLKNRRIPGATLWAACAALLGLALVLSAEMFQLDLEIFIGRKPGVWNLLSAFYIAGSFGAYAVYLAWRAVERLRRRPHDAAPAQNASADPPRRRDILAVGAKAAMAAPFAIAGYGTFIGRDSFQVRETDLLVPDLHPDLDGLRMAQITDLHCGPYLTAKEVDRVVAMANELRPHVAFVTGDLITQAGDPLDECIRSLGGLRADSGVWGCMGNHEHYAAAEGYAAREGLRYGIEFLRQRSKTLEFGDARLNLAGVDYQRKNQPYLRYAETLLRPGSVNLLLSHNPDVFPKATELGYDLVVSGHTHGGQVTIEIVEQSVNAGRFFTPFVVGRYQIDQSQLYVSRGIGTVNLPMRIGALPEVTLLRLKRA